MKELFDTLKSISQSSRFEVDLYSNSGKPLFSTQSKRFNFEMPAFLDESKISQNNGLTYFLLDSGAIGVIKDSDPKSKSLAAVLKQLLDNLQHGTQNLSLSPEKKLKNFLNGEMNPLQSDALKNYYRDKLKNYFLVSIFSPNSRKKLPELIGFLRHICDINDLLIEIDEHTLVFLKKFNDSNDYSSATDFAEVLYGNILEEMRIEIKICIGGNVHSLDELVTAYRQSLFAYNLGKTFDADAAIYNYKEYAIVKLLSEVPKKSLESYLSTLLDDESQRIFADDELIKTAEIFLKNSLNISEASRAMFLHRNTLIYRLDKIESITGLNIRRFNDAVTFRITTLLYKLTKM